jgi:hypothetical protein
MEKHQKHILFIQITLDQFKSSPPPPLPPYYLYTCKLYNLKNKQKTHFAKIFIFQLITSYF